jgi:tripartite ATP-independent transporter DctP family solute receptor
MQAKRFILAWVIMFGFCLGIENGSSYGAEILKVGHLVPPESSIGKGVEHFARLVETKSGGKWIAKVYPKGQLGGAAQLLDQVVQGTLDLAVVPNPLLASRVEKVAVLELPFLFFSYEEADEFLEGKVGRGILRVLSNIGVSGLCYFEEGFMGIASRARAVRRVEDYRGLKIRIASPQFVSESIKLLGASPIRIPIAEVTSTLRMGAADATLTTVTTFSLFKFNEILPYLSLTNQFYVSQIMIVNSRRFEQIGLEVGRILSQAATEASTSQRESSRAYEQNTLRNMEETGVKVVKDPDRASMREAVSRIYEELRSRFDCSECKKFPWCCVW